MRNWQNLFKPEDFDEVNPSAPLYPDTGCNQYIADRANEIVRAELKSSGVAIKLGHKGVGTVDMVGRVVDVQEMKEMLKG